MRLSVAHYSNHSSFCYVKRVLFLLSKYIKRNENENERLWLNDPPLYIQQMFDKCKQNVGLLGPNTWK